VTCINRYVPLLLDHCNDEGTDNLNILVSEMKKNDVIIASIMEYFHSTYYDLHFEIIFVLNGPLKLFGNDNNYES
jgi:hypothetical protein